jgi:ketosteroid isomerase-like protein
MAVAQRAVPSMLETLEDFLEAFNALDLDRVMSHFAEGAVYRPGNGVERVGRAAIREEFEPQFAFGFGVMRFDEVDRAVDEKARKVAIRWICRHDLAHAKPRTLAWKLRRIAVGALVGERFGWEGVDVFHFDEAGKITGKFSYAGYRQPRLEKALGVPLPWPVGDATRA